MTTPTKEAIVDDLVSYIDRQVDEWCYHADIIAMCQTRQKQLLEMKVWLILNSIFSRMIVLHVYSNSDTTEAGHLFYNNYNNLKSSNNSLCSKKCSPQLVKVRVLYLRF